MILRRHWGARRWRVVVGGLLLALGLLAGVVHAPFVRSAVLSWALARLQATGLQAAATRLDYNLFTLSVGVQDITLSATDSDTPFFSADAVQLDLPWSIVGGTFGVQSLEITRPRVHVVQREDGTLNLPETAAAGGAEAEAAPIGPLRVDRFVVRALDARYADQSASLSVDGRGVTLDLHRLPGGLLGGRLSMSDGVTLRVGDRETTIATLDGGVAFDGTALSVDALLMEAPEARIRLDGSVSLLAADPRMDLRYQGRLDAERIAPWAGLDPAPRGQIVFSGTAQGSPTEPDVTLDVSSEELAWSTLGAMSLDARAGMSGSVATLEFFRMAVAGGEISGDARVGLQADGASRVHVTLSNLNLGTLASLAPDLPIRVAAVAGGDVALEWKGQDVTTARGRVTTRFTGPPRQDALTLAGRLDVGLDDGQWTLSIDHRVAETIILHGSANGRLVGDDLAASTLGGHAALEIASLPDALKRLRAAGLELDEALAGRLRGTASAQVDLGGTFNAPRARGALDASELWVDDLGPGTAQVGFDATTRDVTVAPLRLALGPNVVTADVAIGLDANTLRGRVTAELPQLAPLALSLPAEWRPTGAANLKAQFGGTLDNPAIELVLSSRDLRVAGQTLRTVESHVQLADRIVTVSELQLTQDQGRLTATGRYDTTSGRYGFDASGESFAITPLILGDASEGSGDVTASSTIPLDARFDLHISGDGTTASPRARGLVQFSNLDWAEYRLGDLRADLALEDGRVEITASVPSVNATLKGQLDLAAPRAFTATAELVDATLSALARPSGPAGTMAVVDPPPAFGPADIAGALTMRATAGGELDNVSAATVDLDLRLVDAALKGVPLRLARPARLRYAASEVIADDLELHLGSSVLSAKGALGIAAGAGEGLDVQFTGSLADFVPFVRLAPGAEMFDASGAMNLRVRATGSLEVPNLEAEISVGPASVTAASLPPVTDLAVQGRYADGLMELRDLRASWLDATLVASGRAPASLFGDALPAAYRQSLPPQDATARLTGRVGSITAAALAPFMDEETVSRISGRFDAAIVLEAEALDLEKVRADLTLERAELELARVPLGQTRPTHLRLADGRLDIVDWSWAGAGNRLDIAGAVAISGETPQLNLALTGALDLRMLGAFVPDVATTGLASLDVRATGPANDPHIEGQLAFADGDIIVRDPRVAITDIEGTVVLSTDRMELRNVTASANGGTLQVVGSVEYPEFELAGGKIAITGRGLAFAIPQDLRTEVNADLEFDLSPKAPSLTGRVTVLRGSYRAPISLAGQLLTGVQTVPVTPEETEPGFADQIQLGLSVVSDQDILLDNNYGRLEIGTNLKVIGSLLQPVLAGRLTVQEGGEVFLGGQTYQVRRGTVDFANATQVEPNIDLALETRVQRYDITLEVRGTPETLEASLRSPGMSQQDVVSLLLTGRLADESTMAQTEIAQGQLVMLLSGELLGFAGRAIGLDSVQVGRGLGGAASNFDLLAGNTDPSARLTLSKDLRRDVELVFSQSLRESGDITWIAIYHPLRAIEIRGTTEDDGSRAYEFRHQLTFGGALPRARRTARPAEERLRVTAFRFTGAPGFSDTELRDALRLSVGDRFDYPRWQQDHDRLAAFYHERGFLEARIRARRQADESGTDASGVTLEYAIERGPRTTLTIDGFALPGGLVEDMKIAWGEAVFDGFLMEDLETMARQAVTREGYLQAQVTAAVTSPPDSETKEIAVRVTPGQRYGDRRIDFSGNERMSVDELRTLVQTGGLEVGAWLNPRDLELAIVQHYRSIGYLAAAVTAAPAVLSGQSARLPIRVDEGRQFQIASVEVQGVAARSVAEVRAAFGITAQSSYVPSALEPARRQVQVSYLRDGYNDVRVAVTTLVDRERAQVDLALTVDEGRRQVLAGIDVSGARATTRGTVERAVGLEAGQPADLTSVYRAQKRLYDTGVFQSADVTIAPVEGAPAAGGNTEPVRAAVALQEMPLYRFRYGLRLNDEVGPVEVGRQVRPALVVDLLRRNLFGRAVSTGVAGQLEADRRLARGLMSLPQLFGMPVTTNVFLTASREDITQNLIEDRNEITAEQRFRLAKSMAVTYSFSFARSHQFIVNPDPAGGPFDTTTKVPRLTGTYAWDTRDDPSNATRGWLHSSGFDYGPKVFGSDFRFIRYLAQEYYFKTVKDSVVAASAFRLGVGRAFGQELDPSEKFFGGGGTTVRGFAEDGLGEQNLFTQSAAGGNGLLVLNQEVRFPLFKWVRGVGFIDAGNVFARAKDISFSNLEAGTGLGLRIHSPFALIRIDYGVPLTSRPQKPFGRWYFAIGQTF